MWMLLQLYLKLSQNVLNIYQIWGRGPFNYYVIMSVSQIIMIHKTCIFKKKVWLKGGWVGSKKVKILITVPAPLKGVPYIQKSFFGLSDYHKKIVF